jgi:uncharacterized protein with GYD domain
MGTYFMFGSYTTKAIESISPSRTEEAATIISDAGGKLTSAYALLGAHDLVLIADFPDTEHVMKASVALTKSLKIAFTTAPAVPVEEFDKLFP